MTTNLGAKRLRWLMLAVMMTDFTLTLAGQPSGYWKDHSKALEFNALVAAAMHIGPSVVITGWILYAAAAFAVATYLPSRFGAIAAMTFTLAHFTAASSWIVGRFHFGMTGLYLFSSLVAAALILTNRKPKAANQALLPTPMSVTPPAGQEARQP